MMRLVDLRELAITADTATSFVPRLADSSGAVDNDVKALMDDVRINGAKALAEQAERFDNVSGGDLVVDARALKQAAKALKPELRRAMDEAIRRVRLASEESVPAPVTTIFSQGGSVTLRYLPVDRAGVYVPGGKAVYPSSVIMNVVAAQAAGVTDIVLVSPPQQEFQGSIHPSIAAAAHLLGVSEVYALGGAGAIAALAWGVPEIGLHKVSVITGPGNRYVATAKKLVKGVVGIDSEAGPTEIGIIADDTANPEFIAVDLISQAEHDELASLVLVTTSWELATRVLKALERRVPDTAHRERITQSLAGEQSAIMVVDSLEHAVLVVNAIAPEHLEVMLEKPQESLTKLRHAGAIFVGDYTPVSAGDYLAGSNHVLPTGGAAHFSSGLSPMTFLRTQQVVEYDKDALAAISDHVVTFANAEDLPAHGEAVSERFLE
jgi:histidinol dehydrogenase